MSVSDLLIPNQFVLNCKKNTGSVSSSAVTINSQNGVINLPNTSLATGATIFFTFNNSLIKSTSTIILSGQQNNVLNGTLLIFSGDPTTGSIGIVAKNIDGSNALTGNILISFLIL